ncbi:MAG: hypothetical protein AAFZ15_12295, partial [Bacteroidota bacterium]
MHQYPPTTEASRTLLTKKDIEYKNAIEEFASKRLELSFGNKGAIHAAIVVTTIFDNSSEVRIFAHNMNGEISNLAGYYQSLVNFIESGKRLTVVLDGLKEDFPIKKLSQACRFIYEESNKNNNVNLLKASESFTKEIQKISANNTLSHFAIGDDSMIRIETDNDQHIAPFCSFNSKKVASIFIDAFDKQLNTCKEFSF